MDSPKSPFDPNCPPGEEGSQKTSGENSSENWSLLLAIILLMIGAVVGYSQGLANGKASAAKSASDPNVHVVAPELPKTHIVWVRPGELLDYQKLISRLDGCGLRPMTFDEFFAWLEEVEWIVGSPGLGYGAMTIVQSSDGTPVFLWVQSEDSILKMAECDGVIPPTARLLTTRKSVPARQSEFVRSGPSHDWQAGVNAIMGPNFIWPREAEKHLGVKFSEDDRRVLDKGVPYSREVLEQCRDTHILVPMPALSIMEIRALASGTFHDQSWYNDQAFAKEKCRAGWRLIRKTIVPDSAGKNYDEQMAQLGDDEEVPPACELFYAMTLGKLARNEELLSGSWARTSSLSSHGFRVNVDFYDGRLNIYGWVDGDRHDSLGLASAQKFQK